MMMKRLLLSAAALLILGVALLVSSPSPMAQFSPSLRFGMPAAGGTPTTWDATLGCVTGGAIALSGGNLSAVNVSGQNLGDWCTIRSTNTKTTGNLYVELTVQAGITSTATWGIGFCNASATTTTGSGNYLGIDTNGVGQYPIANSGVYYNGSSIGSGPAISDTSSHVYQLGIGLTAGAIKMAVDGGSVSTVSTTIPTGANYVCVSFSGENFVSPITADFGHTSFTYTPFATYSAWGN